MQVVYHKIAVDNCCSSRASSPDINIATASPAIHMVTHAWTATHQWISRLSDAAIKILKKCNILLLIMNSPEGPGATAP